MCLPVVFVLAVGLFVNHLREESRCKLIAYYSQPFEANLFIEPREPAVNGDFRVSADCIALGGNGQSDWSISARIEEVRNQAVRLVWSSKTIPMKRLVNNNTSGVMSWGLGGDNQTKIKRPASHSVYDWMFIGLDPSIDLNKCRFIVEAIAIPKTSRLSDLNNMSVTVTEVKAAQITAGRKLLDAKFLRQVIMLNARG